MIWMSERDNWNHLYMYDRTTAQPIRQITKGEWYVRDILRVDETNQLIYFSANGVQAKEDPYLIRYYRIGFDGKNLTCLTPAEGMHNAWFSKDMQYLVDVYSMVDKAPVAVLRDAKNGKVIMPLETADISRLEAEGWKAPEVFTAKGRDGKRICGESSFVPAILILTKNTPFWSISIKDRVINTYPKPLFLITTL